MTLTDVSRIAYRSGAPTADKCVVCGAMGDGRLINDHCHVHSWVRGTLCRSCNGIMRRVDVGFIPRTAIRRFGSGDPVIAQYLRCPDCGPREFQILPVGRVPAATLAEILGRQRAAIQDANDAKRAAAECYVVGTRARIDALLNRLKAPAQRTGQRPEISDEARARIEALLALPRVPLPAERVRLREVEELAPKDMAELVGVSVVTLLKWEAGQGPRPGPLYDKYAEVLASITENHPTREGTSDE